MLVHELFMARFTLGLSLLSVIALTASSVTANSAEISLVKDGPSLAPVTFSNLHRRSSRKHGESEVIDIKVTEKTVHKSSNHRTHNGNKKHKSSKKGHGSHSVSRKCRTQKHKIVHKSSSKKCRTRKSSKKHGSSHKKSSHLKKCRKGSKHNGGSRKPESTKHNGGSKKPKPSKHGSSSNAMDKCDSLLGKKDISQKEWETFSECRCTASNLHPKNRRGIAICYQVGWFDRRRGMFGGEILVYKKGGEKTGKPFNLEVQWPANPPTLTASDTKLGDKAKKGTSLFSVDPSSKDGIINRFHFSGQLSKSQMQKAQLGRRADVTSQADMISPMTYQLTASGEDTIALERGQDWSNLPLGNNVPAKPFGDFAKLTSDTTPNAPASSSPSAVVPTTAPVAPAPAPAPAPATTTPAPSSTDIPVASVSASPAETTKSSANADSNSQTTSASASAATDGAAPSTTVSAADSTSSSTDAPAAAAGVPGQSLGVAPIGLIVFGIVMVIGVAIVAYNTWERRGYRMQFRRRNEMLQARPNAV